MKILFLLKEHPRNLNLFNEFKKKNGNLNVDLVLMKGEDLLPNPPDNISLNLKRLWKTHFTKRYEFESQYFDINKKVLKSIANNFLEAVDYNDKNFLNFLGRNKYDICFISGIKIIPEKLLKILPNYTINFHLGFIPYYKGSITTFWPFYFLEPHMLGTTYHIIDKKVDNGEILHTSFPSLSKGDSLHESSCKAIIKGHLEINNIYMHCKKRILNNIQVDKDYSLANKGKNFKKVDWKPEMLTFIYDTHQDDIVKNFYDKKKMLKMKYFIINEKLEKEKKTFDE